jgi:hypothetical protein
VVLGWLTGRLVLGVARRLALDGSLAGPRRRAGRRRGAGRAAADTWQRRPSSALRRASRRSWPSGDTIDASSFRAAPDGVVTLTLRREASTIVLHRIAPLRHWTQLSATVVSRPAR